MANADVRWLQRLENYERALATLERALLLAATRPLSELEQQGLIQAFEFTHELSWLLLKDFLVNQGVSGISGSRDAVREAVVRELLPAGTESTWMAMIRSRNLTSPKEQTQSSTTAAITGQRQRPINPTSNRMREKPRGSSASGRSLLSK